MRSASVRPAFGRDGEVSGIGRSDEWSSPFPRGKGTESGLHLPVSITSYAFLSGSKVKLQWPPAASTSCRSRSSIGNTQQDFGRSPR